MNDSSMDMWKYLIKLLIYEIKVIFRVILMARLMINAKVVKTRVQEPQNHTHF